MNKIIAFLLSVCSLHLAAQTDTITFTKVGGFAFENILPYSAYTSLFNAEGDPFLYAACRELGVVTFSIDDITSPDPVDTLLPVVFGGLRPTNLSQKGNYLYVALGGFDGFFPQNAGIAILDLTDPGHPSVLGQWDSSAFDEGAAIAIADEKFAYLGAMDRGVVILNIEDKSDIHYVSSYLPDPDFPEIPDLFSVPNARGLALYGKDTLMVANDAGGLRMLDISDRSNPVEIGKYVNTGIEEIAQSAYNNIAIAGHYAYVPVDMCGLDVVDISTAEMENVFWFNPWDCDSSNWIGRPGHTNEVKIIGDSLLFVSGGDSEVLAFDITDNAHPKLVGEYANVYDSIVAWSIDVRDNYVSLALVNNEILGIPYYSDLGGIYMLEMDIVPFVTVENNTIEKIIISPDPVSDYLFIHTTSAWDCSRVYALSGNCIAHNENAAGIDCSGLSPGLYILVLYDNSGNITGRTQFIKQ